MFSDPITVSLLALIALIVGILLWIFFLRTPLVLLIAMLAIFVANVILNQESLSVEIGQYSINIMDVLSAYLISIAVVRLILRGKWKKNEVVTVLFFGGLLFISWVRGTILFDLETSTNAMRTSLYFFATLFYTATLDFSSELLRKFVFWLGWAGFGLIVIVVFRWIMVGLDLVSVYDWIAPNGAMVRVISGAATFLLLQISIFIYYGANPRQNRILANLVILAIIGMIFVLQQRTVWVIFFISLLSIVVLKSKLRGTIVLGFLCVVVLIICFFAWNNYSIEDLTGTSLDLRNLNWRILGWQTLLTPERFQSILDYFIGQPFGTGYDRYILQSTSAITVSPHNFYIQTFLNIGGLGLITLFTIYGSLLKSLWKARSTQLGQLFILLLISQLVFYLSYAPSFEQGILLGLALLIAQQNRGRRPASLASNQAGIQLD
jgi:O-antigen ligase